MEDSMATCPQCGTKNRLKAAAPDLVPICGKCKSSLPWVVTGTDISFRKELEASTPVLVDFWAEWCGPCRMVGPAVEQLSQTMSDKIKIAKLNVDENQEIAVKYGVRSIPSLLLFKAGKEIARTVGAAPKEAYQKFIEESLLKNQSVTG